MCTEVLEKPPNSNQSPGNSPRIAQKHSREDLQGKTKKLPQIRPNGFSRIMD
jgi:hypothetical protein